MAMLASGEVIGQGAQGVVYHALDSASGAEFGFGLSLFG